MSGESGVLWQRRHPEPRPLPTSREKGLSKLGVASMAGVPPAWTLAGRRMSEVPCRSRRFRRGQLGTFAIDLMAKVRGAGATSRATEFMRDDSSKRWASASGDPDVQHDPKTVRCWVDTV